EVPADFVVIHVEGLAGGGDEDAAVGGAKGHAADGGEVVAPIGGVRGEGGDEFGGGGFAFATDDDVDGGFGGEDFLGGVGGVGAADHEEAEGDLVGYAGGAGEGDVGRVDEEDAGRLGGGDMSIRLSGGMLSGDMLSGIANCFFASESLFAPLSMAPVNS